MTDDERAARLGRLVLDFKKAREERILLERDVGLMSYTLGRVSSYVGGSRPHEFSESEIDRLPSPEQVRKLLLDFHEAQRRESKLRQDLRTLGVTLDPV